MAELNKYPHKRKNILNGEWVLVSPHRTQRPWQGKIESSTSKPKSKYEPGCYLCPGNERAGGVRNPNYNSTFVFNNDFSALLPNLDYNEINEYDLLIAEAEPGICRVVCFSPDHSLSIAEFEIETITEVIGIWIKEFDELGKQGKINYVTIFENKGELMGCSNPHPHGQIWAQYSIPNEALKETEQQRKYLEEKKYCLLCDYLIHEKKKHERIVFENESFVVIIPFWAIWPFETIVIPKRHDQNILKLDSSEKRLFAEALKEITVRYDNLFQTSFPYSMGFHQSPTDGKDYKEWHWHVHFYPPLLRSSTVKKFMVGYEMLAQPQRDLTPEIGAEMLKKQSNTHFIKH
ncbi:MAG: UDP-glucose--hexose-1-phosphate uridylyltransferase [Melioribacteraceae bacterium]|nr:UDP-glucose--hexose-1-phosphate uridylyltransferase [Melioribacteraceae bacterium]